MLCKECGVELPRRAYEHTDSMCIRNLREQRDRALKLMEAFLIAAHNGVVPRDRFIRDAEELQLATLKEG